MLKQGLRTIVILMVLALAGIRLAYVGKALSQAQSIDYSIKTIITAVVIAIVLYLIHVFSPKKQ